VGHDRQLRRESLDVLRLPMDEALRDEEREVGILVPGGLDHPVQGGDDLLPDGVPVRADDHTAAHGRVIGEFGDLDDVLVPAREILRAGSDAFGTQTASLLISCGGIG